MNRLSRCALALAAAFVFAACSHPAKTSPMANNAPDWVNKGSGAFKDEAGKPVFYGVGAIQGVRNIPLALPADDRGRADIAKIMNSYVTVLSKDYMASITAGDMKQSSEEQIVSQTMKNFAKFTLHGAIPVDHWVDKDNGIVYSLVKLDMAAVKQSLDDSKELDSKVRDYVKANAEKAFDELNAEEAKHYKMRRIPILAALGAAVGLAACGGTSVQRLDANQVVDVSGHWNDTDSRLVAEEMISDCLARPWYANATAALGKNPTVIVGAVKNQSSEHIAVDTFVEDLQRALINSGKVDFVASKGERGEVRDERADQDTHASEATRNANGQETGANFMLSGSINSIVDQEGGQAVVFFQTNLKLLNMTTHAIVWNGEKKIKKVVSRSRSSF